MNQGNDLYNLIENDIEDDLILGAIGAIVLDHEREQERTKRDELATNDHLIDRISNGILSQALLKKKPPATYGHIQCDDGHNIYITGGYKPIIERHGIIHQRQQYRPLRDVLDPKISRILVSVALLLLL